MPTELEVSQADAAPQPTVEARSHTATNRSPREMILAVVFLLIAGTFVLYEPSLHNGFINFDDLDYITRNAMVQQGLTWHGIIWAFTTTDQSNWHPMTWISLMATAQFFGAKAMGYHITNLALHAFNVLMIFLLLRLATGYLARSAIVAALFAVFPLNVEAVAWATERKSVLSMAFLLLALLAYGWYVRRPSIGRYLAIMLPFALGLMTKAWIVSIPFALILLDYWPLQRIGVPGEKPQDRQVFRATLFKLTVEKIPLLTMSAASVLISMYAVRQGGALAAYNGHAPLALKLENAQWSYLQYLLKGIWPVRLSIIYPFPQHWLPAWKILIADAAVIGISALVWQYREKRYLLSGWLWFLGVLFPLIGLVKTGPQSMSDRWAYISFLGLFVMAVWLTSEWFSRLRAGRGIAAATTALILLLYASATHAQIGYWRNSYSLFSHAVAVTNDNGYAENNLGIALEQDMGRPDLAIQHYQAAVLLDPDLPTAHYNFGVLLQQQHRFDESLREYNAALAHSWNAVQSGQIHNNMGAIFVQRSELDAAQSEFSAAIQDDPQNEFSFLNRGMLEYRMRNLNAAQSDFAHATQLLPTAGTYFWLGRTLENKGDREGAVDAYETALRMNPQWLDVQTRLNALRK